MPRCGFFGSSPMMAFVVIPEILITTCCGLCGAFNMDVAVCMDAWSLSIFLMLPGMGFILVLMMAFGVNSKTLVNKGVGCLVMLDDGSWVNRETLLVEPHMVLMRFIQVLPLMLEDGIGEHPTTLRVLFSFPSCASSLHVGGSTRGHDAGASSLHVGGSTRGHNGIRVPRKLPAHTRWLLRLYLDWLRVGWVAWRPHFGHVRMLLFRWGGQATTLFVFSGAFIFEEVVFLG
ncbi:hypothetical protein VNO77_27032 [Canavalia gladiata]|uniref:Uncharacterized protein n=1 Tax=Canavalia gladiata TaxID=3824 RepID=A0AAN9Q3U9_CANGL